MEPKNFSVATQDALDIWQAGVDSVRADRVVESQTHWDGRWLSIGEYRWDLKSANQLIVVGAGKASGGMLDGFVNALYRSGHTLPPMTGWINVPEGVAANNLRIPRTITVSHARPAGRNEPTELVVAGTQQILQRVRNSGPNDCVVALISGGGSALLCSPVDGLSLNEKILLSRALSTSGANIEELNSVRRCLSNVKGGGLARACPAKQLVCCILSDVLGDPLEYIASGPTVLSPAPDPKKAIEVMDRFLPGAFPDVRSILNNALHRRSEWGSPVRGVTQPTHVVLANNATAVDAAGTKAVELGYRYCMTSERRSEGDVLEFCERLSSQISLTLKNPEIDCIISGGEPTVRLPLDQKAGKGGRNQQLALGVLDWFKCHRHAWPSDSRFENELAFVSGGTDGEDGPTDAAGAFVDRNVYNNMVAQELDPKIFLSRCDAYSFFEKTGGLIKTGPTNTNVCDLRVAVIKRNSIA